MDLHQTLGVGDREAIRAGWSTRGQERDAGVSRAEGAGRPGVRWAGRGRAGITLDGRPRSGRRPSGRGADRKRVVVRFDVDRLLLQRRARRCGFSYLPRRVVAQSGRKLQDWLADMPLAAWIVARQIEMEMIVVEHVGAWAEHGVEVAACADKNLTQELLFLRRAPPAPHDRHLASVGEAEGHDIDRVAEGVLGQPRAALAV